jgi:hypothetical protein
MAKWETSEMLHNTSLESEAIGAASEGSPAARKAAPAITPMPDRRTLQFLIAVIKNSQRRSPSQQN